MMLCLDCGNSRLKWGWLAAGKWQAKGALGLDDITEQALSGYERPRRILACNVAGERGRRAIAALVKPWTTPIEWFAATRRCCGVSNGYREPQRLGADRWAALIGARAHHTGDALVVSAGTATTIDLLTAEGQFLGGLILPGLALMRRALAQATADLPDVAGQVTLQPNNTGDAIASGAIFATAGAIERLFRQLDPRAHPLCLLTGGASHALTPWLELPYRRIDDLVLEGLRIVAEHGGEDLSQAWGNAE